IITRKPMENRSVRVITSTGNFVELITDANGRFGHDNFHFYGKDDFIISTGNLKGKQTEYILELDTLYKSPSFDMMVSPLKKINFESFLHQAQDANQVMKSLQMRKDITLLKEV